MFAREYGMLQKVVFSFKSFPETQERSVSEKWNVRDKANFVKLFFFFFLFVLSCLS